MSFSLYMTAARTREVGTGKSGPCQRNLSLEFNHPIPFRLTEKEAILIHTRTIWHKPGQKM